MPFKAGNIVAISIGGGVFCYLRAYRFGQGVLPFLSRGLVTDVSAFPTLIPRFYIHTWIYTADPTPRFTVGHVPLAAHEESLGPAMYWPPSPIQNCFTIYGLSVLLKPATAAQLAGLEEFRRYQPADLRSLLFARYDDWVYLKGVPPPKVKRRRGWKKPASRKTK